MVKQECGSLNKRRLLHTKHTGTAGRHPRHGHRKQPPFTQSKPQCTPSVHHAQTFSSHKPTKHPTNSRQAHSPQPTPTGEAHNSSFPASFFCPPPPPTSPPSHDAPGMATRAAGGYGLPSTSTLGSHVHHSSSGTPERALGMCLPQPRQDFFAVTGGPGCQREIRRTLIKYGSWVQSLQHSGHVAPKHILLGWFGRTISGLVWLFVLWIALSLACWML